MMAYPLLTTKFFIPLSTRYRVHRPALAARLDRILDPGCCLALVSAPAGFGKTALLAAWTAALDQVPGGPHAAWLSIDEGDNDPVTFWTYFTGALQQRQPGIGAPALAWLGQPGADLTQAAALLINELAASPRPWVVVLDDYHLVRSPGIHRALAYFIEHAPPHLHTVLATRADPPLPLALLRGRGRLLEIRLNDLRFSNDEARSYLNASTGIPLPEQAVVSLNQKAEGWIAGLQLAALALQDLHPPGASAPDPAQAAAFIDSFSGSNRFILDYLMEEVLNRQPEAMQRFLLQTSILEQLCGPLCDALLQDGDAPAQGEGQTALEALEQVNLFIIPLDHQRRWYRYHHLFADLLRKRLAQSDPLAVQRLHRRAARWFEQNAMLPQAIQHAFQVPDMHQAAAWVAQVTEELWGRGEHATLLGWMSALPDHEKQAYPHLLIYQVSMLISAGKIKEAEACIPLLESHIESSLSTNPDQPILRGQAAALRTYIASFYGDRAAVFTQAETALQYLTRPQDAGQRCGVSLVLGNACLDAGRLQEGVKTLSAAAADAETSRKPHMVLTALSIQGKILWFQGQLNRAFQVCQQGLELIDQHQLDQSPMAADLRLAWGALCCERGLLDEAESFLRQGLQTAQTHRYTWQTAWGLTLLARLLLTQGDPLQTESAALEASAWIAAHQVPTYYEALCDAVLSQAWVRQGKQEQARSYLQGKVTPAGGELVFPQQFAHLAWARVERLQSPGTAGSWFEPLLASSEPQGLVRFQVEAYLQQALTKRAQGQPTQAAALLRQALELAQPQGAVQVFRDEGQPLADLLREVFAPGSKPPTTPAAQFAAQILAYHDHSPAPAPPPPTAKPAQPPTSAPALAEPLSRRELETLRLMAEGLSNKEIGLRLHLSLRTVKYYSTGLFNKLGVDSRMQAVKRARELGLL